MRPLAVSVFFVPLLAASAAAAGFEEARSRAQAAHQAQRLDEAAQSYHEALDQQPKWDEGRWALGTVLYELERWGECRQQFEQLTANQPQLGGAWAFRGLCEFRERRYDAALGSLERITTLGLPEGSPIAPVAQYHLGALLTRAGRFEESIRLLEALAAVTQQPSADLIEALGLSMLRVPALPGEAAPRSPESERRNPEAVRLAGNAAYLAATSDVDAARKLLEDLTARFPKEPNAHYAFGAFLLNGDADRAIAEFRRELEVSPGSVAARLQLAFEFLKRNQFSDGLPYAREAVAAKPDDFAARHAYGRLLLGAGDVGEAVRQLEAAVRLAPDSPQSRFALARAYSRAGRKQDSEREHAEFQRLEKLQQKR
ncbi:MAG: tetratricopeptide repeat protein [Bryobacterales bacterium]